jgi:actin-like ATPase involved in cell morphogenesis
MVYALGVDLGTSFTAAAVFRDERVEIASLGNRSVAIPSVVLLRGGDEILAGDAADRRAQTEPGRVAREFKRRMGDSTPIYLGGSQYSAEQLMARLLRWVADEISAREGGPPDHLALSHPANWAAYKRRLLEEAVRFTGLPPATLVTEPEAAAIHFSAQERVEIDDVVAVYDLGGGTFDAAVLRKTADGFEILGRPEGIEHLGGIDFDAAVFAHVARSLPGGLGDLDEDDPAARSAVARLRKDCVEAKEALSSDVDVSIPVLLPGHQTEIRLTRTEYEAMIRPSLADSIQAMHRALESAGVVAPDLSAVLLVGGSSRTPLVSQMVGSELGRPVAVDTHPKHGTAMGAALAAARAAKMPGAGGTVAADAGDEPDTTAPISAAGAVGAAAAAAGIAAGAVATGSHGPTPGETDDSVDGSAVEGPAVGGDPTREQQPAQGDPTVISRAPAGVAAGAAVAAGASTPGAGDAELPDDPGAPPWYRSATTVLVFAVLVVALMAALALALVASGGDDAQDPTTSGTPSTVAPATTAPVVVPPPAAPPTAVSPTTTVVTTTTSTTTTVP